MDTGRRAVAASPHASWVELGGPDNRLPGGQPPNSGGTMTHSPDQQAGGAQPPQEDASTGPGQVRPWEVRVTAVIPADAADPLAYDLRRVAERARARALARTLRGGTLKSAKAGDRAAERVREDQRLADAATALGDAARNAGRLWREADSR